MKTTTITAERTLRKPYLPRLYRSPRLLPRGGSALGDRFRCPIGRLEELLGHLGELLEKLSRAAQKAGRAVREKAGGARSGGRKPAGRLPEGKPPRKKPVREEPGRHEREAEASNSPVSEPGGEEFAKLVTVAIYLTKRGVISFERYLLELKLSKLIGEIEQLTSGQLAVFRKAFAEGLEKSRASDLMKYGQLSERIRGVYTAKQVDEVTVHGQLLGLKDREIQDFLEMGSIAKPNRKPPKVPLTPEQLKEQMVNWRAVVQPRGYPYLFESAASFERFKSALKTLLKQYDVPEGRMVVQGSALRTPAAKDVDIAIFVSDEVFERYAAQCRAGIRARAEKPHTAERIVRALDDAVQDGYIPRFYFDRPIPSTFSQDAKDLLEVPFGLEELDVSVMKSSSRIALQPSLDM